MWQLSLDSSTCNAVKQISVGIATRAVCVSENMKKLLIGTQRCSILEIELPSTGESFNTLVSGHFKDEVWGLAVRPPVPGYPRQTGKTEVLLTLVFTGKQITFNQFFCICSVTVVTNTPLQEMMGLSAFGMLFSGKS